MPKTLTLSKSYIIFPKAEYFHFERRNPRIRQKQFLIIGILIFFLILIYIFQINLATSRNYEIRVLEKNLSILSQENQKIKSEALSIKSSQVIFEKAKDLGLEEASSVQYVKISTPILVRNK